MGERAFFGWALWMVARCHDAGARGWGRIAGAHAFVAGDGVIRHSAPHRCHLSG